MWERDLSRNGYSESIERKEGVNGDFHWHDYNDFHGTIYSETRAKIN